MPDERTLVTELCTGIGMLGVAHPVLAGVDFLATECPPALEGVDHGTWQTLREAAHRPGRHRDVALAMDNGHAFLSSLDGLGGRPPRRIEWTGGRRLPDDDTIPADLRVDRVYLVSCKYQSQLLHNASPSRLFEGLLAKRGGGGDWYLRTAPAAYQALYDSCRHLVLGLPHEVGDLAPDQRRQLSLVLAEGLPDPAASRYAELCQAVAESTAESWRAAIGAGIGDERMLRRLLRLAPAPYFVLGTQGGSPVRLRVDTHWDWHNRYEVRSLHVEPVVAGQPTVRWRALCRERPAGGDLTVEGHVEIRWSHGRFRQPPEAKVYLDTAHDRVPGYHPLGPDGA